MSDIVCPQCATDEHLRGEREGELIRITCEACDVTWTRDPSPVCPTCGSREVRAVPQAVWQKTRGNQLHTTAVVTVHLCPDCDRDALRDHLASGTPIPPKDNPAAGWRG